MRKSYFILLFFSSFFLLIAYFTPTFFRQETLLYQNKEDNIFSQTGKEKTEKTYGYQNASQPISLRDHTVTFFDGEKATFRVADPFNISVAQEGLGKARFMAWSPDGRLFIPDLVNMNLSHQGKIYVLEDFDKETKKFRKKTTYLSGLRGPNSVAFYRDENGQDWIYIALTAHVIRYPYHADDTKPSGKPEIIISFPNKQAPGATGIVWHITRTIRFYKGRLYISVGSGCNACEQPKDEMRAMIYSVKPDGTDVRIHARDLRNAVGFTFANNTLYATNNGVDHLGEKAPNDMLYKIKDGSSYGWPYCYEIENKIIRDNSRQWTIDYNCEEVPLSLAAFPPHSAPLGVSYFDDEFISPLADSFLVALHGSFQVSLRAGYHIVKVKNDGTQEIFIDGFLKEKSTASHSLFQSALAHEESKDTTRLKRVARPVDILPVPPNAFFFTDDLNGRLYYVYAEEKTPR